MFDSPLTLIPLILAFSLLFAYVAMAANIFLSPLGNKELPLRERLACGWADLKYALWADGKLIASGAKGFAAASARLVRLLGNKMVAGAKAVGRFCVAAVKTIAVLLGKTLGWAVMIALLVPYIVGYLLSPIGVLLAALWGLLFAGAKEGYENVGDALDNGLHRLGAFLTAR